ncbi:MAG TPA: NADH-quinone oxidoreductase subunit A [Acidimicrobiia bacterium]|nr:NADH-quinone oxidoreductase subunit A [Acidimicrobiia bacterium]
MSLTAYLPIAIMFLLVVGFGVISMLGGRLMAPRNPTPEKLEPYECGIVPLQEPVQRFPVKFYLVAMLFVIFDIEIVFLFAWASRFEQLGWYGVAAVGIFTFLLVETLIYVWKRGALDWNVERRSRYQRRVVAPDLEEAA